MIANLKSLSTSLGDTGFAGITTTSGFRWNSCVSAPRTWVGCW